MSPPATPGLALADVFPPREANIIGIPVHKARRRSIRFWVVARSRETPVSVGAAPAGGGGVDRVALGILSSIRHVLV